ncbi:hypothetical protein BpHYR1_048041, partial [Brachionus plicatilis]
CCSIESSFIIWSSITHFWSIIFSHTIIWIISRPLL